MLVLSTSRLEPASACQGNIGAHKSGFVLVLSKSSRPIYPSCRPSHHESRVITPWLLAPNSQIARTGSARGGNGLAGFEPPSWLVDSTRLDVFAPGCDITSAWIQTSNNGPTTISETSMAAPHVTGLALTLIAKDLARYSSPASITAGITLPRTIRGFSLLARRNDGAYFLQWTLSVRSA